MTASYETAVLARSMYRRGEITKAEAKEMMAGYIDEYNARSQEAAARHGVRPKAFNLTAFLR